MPAILVLTVSLFLPGVGKTEPATLQFERPSMERCQADGEALVRENDGVHQYSFVCRAGTAL